jgi:hypothetical protein
MPIAAAIRTAGPTVPVRRGASTQRTTAIPAKRAGRPAGPARRSIHSAEVLAPGHTRHAHSGTRGNQSPYHETYKGNAPSPVRRSPRHGQRFHEQGHPRGCGTNETRQRFLAEIGNHRLRFAFADLPDPPQSECYGRAHRTEPTWQMRYRREAGAPWPASPAA